MSDATVPQLVDQALAHLRGYPAGVLQSPLQVVAHLGALLGVTLGMLGALARTMMPLRWLAVGSNLGLIVYGALHPSPITLAIATVLLPINIFRAVEATRLARRVIRSEAASAHAGLWLRPYMKSRKLRPGQTLFSKGDPAQHLYLLLSGELELVEIGKSLDAGRVFGEIALFSPSGLRTTTVRCVTGCTVLEIHESTVKQLYYQNPAFGFHLIGLLAARLSGDVARAEAQLQAAHAPPAA